MNKTINFEEINKKIIRKELKGLHYRLGHPGVNKFYITVRNKFKINGIKNLIKNICKIAKNIN